jgi:stress response protein YsnF
MSSDEQKIQLVEETATISKECIVTGRVRVTTSSDTVEHVANATLEGARVEVTRQRLNREVVTMPEPRLEGDTTIRPVGEEIVVVEKRLVLVEEIRIRNIATREEVAVPVTLRKQTVNIERIKE